MKVYLAGPMTGIPFYNYPAFVDAATTLRAIGHEVFSPAERDIEREGRNFFFECPTGREAVDGFSRRTALGDDLEYICRHADGIAMLPGWEASSGARAEHAAAMALNLEFIYIARTL